MTFTGPAGYPGNLNPTAPEFLPANQHPIHFFLPTRIYHPLPPPPPPPFFPNFSVAHLPPPLSIPPTRAVILVQVPSDVSEWSIRQDMEVFGEVRGVQMERVNEGIVTVHFYNLKDSQKAVRKIRECHPHMQREQLRFRTTARGLVSGRVVWAHFALPQITAVEEGNNQGSLVIMNLEPTVSSATLRHLFQVFGEVKELRETPYKKEQRFIEFYDVRDAAKALREMNGKSIAGKPVVIQYSRPGGRTQKFFLDPRFNKSLIFNHYHPPPPPPPPRQHYHCRLVSPAGQFGRRGAVKGKLLNEQQQKNNHYRKHTKMNLIGECFVIKEEGIVSDESRDGRTTVMIKNIPNKYSQKMFLNLLDSHCEDCNEKIVSEGNNIEPLSSYDFVYLPIDFSNKCNVGYGFVNMTSPEAVWRLYKAYHNHQWGVFNSKKVCEVTYARLQGVESLKEHFKNSKLLGGEGAEEYMPVLFSPPRDGKVMTEPVPVGYLGTKLTGGDSCHCRDGTVPEKTLEEVMVALGERIEDGGVLDDESLNSSGY